MTLIPTALCPKPVTAMAGEGLPSTPNDAGSDKDMDGRPSPTMTRWGRTVETLGRWYEPVSDDIDGLPTALASSWCAKARW